LNFPRVEIVNRTIESIPLKQWEKWQADVWLMSPPCQPFTRQGKQDDLHDRRTDGFVYLLKIILPQLCTKPKYILVENVSGFEYSQAHRLLLDTLEQSNYHSQQFLLSPIQFGIPNSRLRYYLIACQKQTGFSSTIQHRISNFERLHRQLRQQFPSKVLPSIDKTMYFNDRLCNDRITEQCSQSSDILVDRDQTMFINDFLLADDNNRFELDDKQLKRGAHVSDIISCYSQRSFCFTKSYGKYFEGTGSLLAIESDRLRYLSPKEIANLHCFPLNFDFPLQVTIRQCYALLGNSLNVFVVAVLMENLFERS
jgi:tRNA (cytosine38-C5)-methyltransferase